MKNNETELQESELDIPDDRLISVDDKFDKFVFDIEFAETIAVVLLTAKPLRF